MFISVPLPPLHNTNNHCVGTRNHCVGQSPSKNYWKTTLRAPCLSGVPPLPFTTQTTTVWAYETTVWVNSPVTTRWVQENKFKSPMVIRGFPLPVYNTNNYCVGTRNHCVSQYPSKNYWKTTLRAPCLSGVPLHSEYKQPLFGHTEPLCGQFPCAN